MVTVPADVLVRYQSFTLYNSPFPAHDDGCAIDLYPDADAGAPSPVAGRVTDTRTVRAPTKPYAAEHDHLIVIDTDGHLARVLHVDPGVEPGDAVSVGDSLGELIRSGYFAPWVDNHIHLGFRSRDANPYRATGSVRVNVGVEIVPVPWDGTGTVTDRDETYVVLDAPGHPAPGERFAGVADGAVDAALDGGLPHYQGGGRFGGDDGPVTVAGTRVGTARGRTIAWDDVEVRANGTPITGISFAVHRDRLGVKLVSWEGVPAEIGDGVSVTVH